MNIVSNSLWVEKYRPSGLDGYVGNEYVMEKFRKYIEDDDVPHLLLHGRAGTGKTTAAKLLVNNLDCDVIYINASDENNIETIRTKIKTFVSSVGFKKWKIVILDECLEVGTLVTVLRNGIETKVQIELLDEDNDLVKSYNIKTDQFEWQPFKLFNKGEREIWEIELENGELVRCTEEHKWFVHDENDEVIVVKTSELINYNHILSPI